MLLSITYTGANASDLGYLLHKNPNRPQVFELNFGRAYVFYPEAGEHRCTAALLLDIDPVDLARGKVGSKDGGIFDYVSDRPYVCSSFMSTAISRVYGSAMAGRCAERPDLAGSAMELSAEVAMLPCRGDKAMMERVFAPLGYSAEFSWGELDERFPEWGPSPYVDLTLRGTVRLRDLLMHLYVLIPVFDRQKHYWMGDDEVEKLLRHGEGWLEAHPERDFIVKRYLNRGRHLARMALDRLEDGQSGADDEAGVSGDGIIDSPPSLNKTRLEAIVAVLKDLGVRSVIDMGCGEGNLLRLLLNETSFARIAGTDLSPAALARAGRRLQLDRMPEAAKNRLTLFQGSLTYRDERFKGYDAAACVEVMEHIDLNRLPAFERVLFECARPRVILLTTPNVEYNENYEFLGEGRLRHGDHRFEWTREQFREWGGRSAQRYGYSVSYIDIGDGDAERGAPTQMGVFTLCRQNS
ncbi:MAG: 3' terminal RNA ribose 2'-O-methyltransferase Hen1 [Synergistaceae bacterium]|jgi:3' terminal RNA ribose 2'-O-methyltransferase Hen1|nr:3' terminal RNA ribose 2'-O-methyltransferase Hen1 [Synergistaceae bacterium]